MTLNDLPSAHKYVGRVVSVSKLALFVDDMARDLKGNLVALIGSGPLQVIRHQRVECIAKGLRWAKSRRIASENYRSDLNH